jgi:hypothetical protein
MNAPSPFAGLQYTNRDEDLVRFRESPIDDDLSNVVRSIFDALDEHREDVRRDLDEDDHDTLAVFARRRAVVARRTASPRAVSDALDAYALLTDEGQVPWESWFKATLVIGRELGMPLDDARRRFVGGATENVARRAEVAFDGVSRVADLAQCHVIEVNTSYGVSLLETTVVRDQNTRSWGGLTGVPVRLGQYQVDFAPTTNLAQAVVDVADALDATGELTTSSIRQDQLVGSMFDLVTSGSYVDSLGCLSVFADGTDGQPIFTVTVAEVATEEYDDVRYDALDIAEELAQAADAIEDQWAVAVGPVVVVLAALPNFDEDADDEPVDLSSYRDLARDAVGGE